MIFKLGKFNNFFYHFLKTQVDELTSGVLVREDATPLKEDITLSTECKYFWIKFQIQCILM